jgi:hypothetical protein
MTATCWLPTTPARLGRGDVRGRFTAVTEPGAPSGGDVWGRFAAAEGRQAGSGGDVWGRLAVSTAGAWSLYSLATPTIKEMGVGSC